MPSGALSGRAYTRLLDDEIEVHDASDDFSESSALRRVFDEDLSGTLEVEEYTRYLRERHAEQRERLATVGPTQRVCVRAFRLVLILVLVAAGTAAKLLLFSQPGLPSYSSATHQLVVASSLEEGRGGRCDDTGDPPPDSFIHLDASEASWLTALADADADAVRFEFVDGGGEAVYFVHGLLYSLRPWVLRAATLGMLQACRGPHVTHTQTRGGVPSFGQNVVLHAAGARDARAPRLPRGRLHAGVGGAAPRGARLVARGTGMA